MSDKCEAYVLVGNASHRIKVQCIRLEHEGVEHEAMIPAFVDPEYAYVRERGSMRIVSTDYVPPKPVAEVAR